MTHSIDSNKVDSLTDFIDRTEIWEIFSKTILFRGQAVKRSLIPAIARENYKNNTMENEKKMLSDLKLMGASFLKGDENDLELLVLAQHYGLKTRLLDWTSNPLAALWFACSSEIKGDCYVYALEADKLLKEGLYNLDPFSHRSTKAFQPRLSNARIIAQHGWFTLHCYANKNSRYVPLEHNSRVKGDLHEYVIPEKRRNIMLRALDRVGVSHRTLFPDLTGLCLNLNWRYK